MKKSVMMVMAAAFMLAACEKNEEPVTAGVVMDEWQEQKVTFTFGGDGARTRASLAELNMTDLWAFDYVGGELAGTVHVTDDLSAVTLSLGYGEHRLCFVASRGTGPSVDGGVITWEKPSDTFWATMAIDVQPSVSASRKVVLRRVATRLRIVPADLLTADMARLVMTPSVWYYGLDVLTGEGCSPRQQAREVSIPSSYVGTSGKLPASFFGLSPSDAWQTDVAVTLCKADGTSLGSVTVEGVRMQQNVTSVYSGGVTGRGGIMSVSADDAWGEDDVHEW
jgi:hypothetical protein